MANSTIGIRLSDYDVERMDRTIKDGYFTSRSDFIRESVREKLKELEEKEGYAYIIRRVAKERGINDVDVIEAARKARKDLYSKEFENDQISP